MKASSDQPPSATDAAGSPADSQLSLRARRGFATVQLTMLSIVVALVLENLLSVLFELPNWTPLIGLQALDVLTSAFSMWVGFAFALTIVDKQPSVADFLNPFLMLIFLSLATHCISTGNLAGFFLAGACGTTSSSINLWFDVRSAEANGLEGPRTTMYLLMGVAGGELVAALALWIWPTAIYLACAFLLANTLLQAATASRSVVAWRQVTA